MAASKLNLKIEQGATFARVITWKAGTPPVAVDLTGCAARMQVREKVASPVRLLDLTTENGGIVLGGTAGTISITASAALTSDIGKRAGVYDLEIEFADGTVRRLLQGAVAISQEVTRE